MRHLKRGINYLKFMLSGLPSFIVAVPLNYVLVEWLKIPKSPAYALVLAFQVSVNFFMVRWLVFNERTARTLLAEFLAFFSGIMLFRVADWFLYSALIHFAGTMLQAHAGPHYYLAIQLANVVLFSILKFLFSERLFKPNRDEDVMPPS